MSDINEGSRFISGRDAESENISRFRARLILAAQRKVELHEKLAQKGVAVSPQPLLGAENQKLEGHQLNTSSNVPMSQGDFSCRLSEHTKSKIREITQKCASRTELNFSALKLGHGGLSFILASVDFASLKMAKLDFSECDIGGNGMNVVYKIVELSPSIVELNLSKNNIGQDGIHWLKKLLQDGKLQVLKLSHNGLNDSDIEALFEVLAQTDTLKGVDLGHNLLGSMTGAVITRYLPRNQSLRCLDLSHNELGAEGARNMVEGVLENRSLERLDLSWNSLNDQGMVHVAEILLRAPCLKEIALNGNFITVAGAQHIAQSLRENSGLEVLEMAQNFLRNAGACALVRGVRSNPSSKLRLMNLNGTLVEREFAAMHRRIEADHSSLEITGFCVLGENMPSLYRRKSSKMK